MSAILGTSVTGAGGGAYTIDNSLRTRASASAYLNRTPSVAGNRRTWTYSGWIKRGSLSANQPLFEASTGSNNDETQIYITSANVLTIQNAIGGTIASGFQVITTQVFRDPGSWYHIVVAVDTTQASISNAVKVYINGSQVTAFSTQGYGGGQNQNTYVNSTNSHLIAKNAPSDNFYYDGYFAEVRFIDGQALSASSFGETNASTGVWQPKAYAGSYGTNGFYLKFSDIATTSGSNAGLGKDFSGNGNYWNTNNISVTSGVTYDAMKDSPTPASSTVGNFPTLNPLVPAGGGFSAGTLSSANLNCTNSSNYFSVSTIATPTTGKFYFEYTQTSSISSGSVWIGVSTNSADNQINGYAYASDGRKVAYNSYTSGYGATWTQNDVIGCAIDLDNQTITFYKNNVSQGTAFTSIPQTNYYFGISTGGTASSRGGSFNFGQRPFAYTPPAGFNRLQTFNLPTPTIGASATTLANKYFDTVLYTGNGGTQAVTGLNFSPDLVWVKRRSSAIQHSISDTSQGAFNWIQSNSNAGQSSDSGSIQSFDSNGFTMGNGSTVNTSGQTYVGWCWDGGSAVTNTNGSITSTVRANTTSGFSVVSYTGPSGSSGNQTIGHGLGATPAMILVKSLNYNYNWDVYHQSLGYNSSLILNSTSGTRSGAFGANPNSTVFTATQTYTWDPNISYVAYCFAEKTGYSKFSTYVGNGNTSGDGTFIYLGFRPAFFMCKPTNSSSGWEMLDNERLTYNGSGSGLYLYAENSGAENQYGTASSGTEADFLSNGIKLKGGTGINANGVSYIYMAFAENPFNYSLAR